MDKPTWRDYTTPGVVFDTILLTILIIGLIDLLIHLSALV